jgi:polyhydroxybutyrate depolymerase
MDGMKTGFSRLGLIAVLPALLIFAGMTQPAWSAAPCGDAALPCPVAHGTYYAAVPTTPLKTGERRPAVLFFHGAGGSGLGVLNARSAIHAFVDEGYVVLGPNGLDRPGSNFGPGWSFMPDKPQLRDELGFAHEVLDDAEKNFGIDRQRVIISGFSVGSSLVWYLACKDPALGTAYAPFSGGFWRPHPTTCAGPIDLFHTHGWSDQTVPLEGRPLGGGVVTQGDIFEGLQLWRRINGCRKLRADTFDTDTPVWQRRWSSCDSGKEIVLALHTGGHYAPAGWARMVDKWFQERLIAAKLPPVPVDASAPGSPCNPRSSGCGAGTDSGG